MITQFFLHRVRKNMELVKYFEKKVLKKKMFHIKVIRFQQMHQTAILIY